MALLNYREVEWDHLETDVEQGNLARKEMIGWIITIVLLCGAGFLFDPVRNLFLTDEELLRKYARNFAWLNRCDVQCEDLINIQLLDLQRDCRTLNKWFYEEGRREPYSWKLAVDDRATDLGCMGFPKEIEDIDAIQDQQTQEKQEQIVQTRIEREEKLRLKQGQLQTVVEKVEWDPEVNSDLIRVTVTKRWLTMNSQIKDQYAVSIKQKWAQIHSISGSNRAIVELVTAGGTLIQRLE